MRTISFTLGILSSLLGILSGLLGLGVAVAYLTFIDAATETGYVVGQITATAAIPLFATGIAGACLAPWRPRAAAWMQAGAGVLGGVLTFSLGLFPGLVLVVSAILSYSSWTKHSFGNSSNRDRVR